MGKRTKPGKKLLAKILSESLFNPDLPGPMKIVSDMQNPAYAEIKAMELIQQAHECVEKDSDPYKSCITQAISLLALAKAWRLHGPTV